MNRQNSGHESNKITVVNDFYRAFANRDAAGMCQFYADNVLFSDPVFGELHGSDVATMWQMLCTRGEDLTVSLLHAHSEDDAVIANWMAKYTFSQTGRSVENNVTARFEFTEDKISRHADYFDLWAWSRMALGFPGILLGWAPPFQKKLQATATLNLKHYKEKLRL